MAGFGQGSVDAGVADDGSAACLALVGRLHGLRVTPGQLSGLGARWDGLAGTLAAIGFEGRLLHWETERLADVARALPAVVRLNDGRCLVLAELGEGGVATLLDPRRGDVAGTLGRDDFLTLWSGEVLLLAPLVSRTAAGPARVGWRWLAVLAWQDGRTGLDLAIATAVSAGLALTAVLFARAFADDTVTGQTPNTLGALAFGIAVLVCFEWAFAGLRQALVRRLVHRLAARLDRVGFERLLGLPLDVLQAQPAAALARSVAAARDLPGMLIPSAARAMLDAVVGLVLVGLLVTVHAGLALLTAALAILGVLAVFPLARRLSRASGVREAASAAADDLLTETLRGFPAVKALSLEAGVRRRWDTHVAAIARADLAEARAAGRLELGVSLLAWLIGLGPFVLGVTLAVSGTVPFGRTDLFVVLLACGRLAASLEDLLPLARALDRARAALAALATLIEAAPEAGRGRPGLLGPISGQISFVDVRHTYAGALAPALDGVSFEVAAGSMFGIMGRSGAGKSTVARLLQRAVGDHDGLVKLDGVDVRQYDLGQLRRSVMVLGDDVPLLAGTVRANIEAGLGPMPDEAVADALRVSGLDDILERLPHGLATMLDEAVPLLSDGQRQRLAITRAVLARPAILVLDEATTALDEAGEAVLLASLRRAAPRQTLVVASQRLATLARADVILVLDKGEVRDVGRHSDLVNRSDLYTRMWQQQAGRLRLGRRPGPLLPRLDSHVA